MDTHRIEIKSIAAEDTWPIRHRVMWPDKPFDYIKLSVDQEGIHWGLFKEGHLISVISAFLENGNAQFRKFATEVDEQGNGYGSRLLAHLIDYLKDQSVFRIWCNARVEKASFYERFGLRKTDQTFSRGNVNYVIMEIILS